ncbi:excisionase [Raoultella sp. WB_B2P2-3]|uniref:Excisionase n=2 Tax=Raoultella scottii TaxID=3040937 RepID=A0ABU8ZAX9_9ENTR|nr:excisionase [Raoultella terrigena]
MARKVLLAEWAKEEFGDPVPGITTLNKYAKNGMIYPHPVKVGRSWRVESTARFVGMTSMPEVKRQDHPLLRRILEDGKTTKT